MLELQLNFETSREQANEKGCDIGYAPAICSLRESLQRGYMHRRSP